MLERSVVFIKPDGLAQSSQIYNFLDSSLQARVEFHKTEPRLVSPVPQETLREHYQNVAHFPWFEDMIERYSQLGISLSCYWTMSGSDGNGILVPAIREIVGPTDPAKASQFQVRGRFRDDSIADSSREGRVVRNKVHASGSPAEGEREFRIWQQYLPDELE